MPPITGRAGSIADNLHDITDDIPTNAAPNPTRPAIPPSLVEPPPNAPMPTEFRSRQRLTALNRLGASPNDIVIARQLVPPPLPRST